MSELIAFLISLFLHIPINNDTGVGGGGGKGPEPKIVNSLNEKL